MQSAFVGRSTSSSSSPCQASPSPSSSDDAEDSSSSTDWSPAASSSSSPSSSPPPKSSSRRYYSQNRNQHPTNDLFSSKQGKSTFRFLARLPDRRVWFDGAGLPLSLLSSTSLLEPAITPESGPEVRSVNARTGRENNAATLCVKFAILLLTTPQTHDSQNSRVAAGTSLEKRLVLLYNVLYPPNSSSCAHSFSLRVCCCWKWMDMLAAEKARRWPVCNRFGDALDSRRKRTNVDAKLGQFHRNRRSENA